MNSDEGPTFPISGPRNVLDFDGGLFTQPSPDTDTVEHFTKLPWQQNKTKAMNSYGNLLFVTCSDQLRSAQVNSEKMFPRC